MLKLSKDNFITIKNELGTDFTIELSKNAIWCGGTSYIKGRYPIVNLPTEEVFTTPNKHKTNGVVYTSMPLVHSGIIIKDIMLEFKDGKIINYNASEGIEELKNIVERLRNMSPLYEDFVKKNKKSTLTIDCFYKDRWKYMKLYNCNIKCTPQQYYNEISQEIEWFDEEYEGIININDIAAAVLFTPPVLLAFPLI